MNCQRCGRPLECTKSGLWVDTNFDFICHLTGDEDVDDIKRRHRPKIESVDALEAWLDAP